MFGVAAVLTAVGAASPAAVAIVAPIALGFAAEYGISPLLMGLLVVHGAQAGGFSPISIYGVIVNGLVARADLPQGEITLFLGSLVFNLVFGVIVFLLFGGLGLLRRERAQSPRLARTIPPSPTQKSKSRAKTDRPKRTRLRRSRASPGKKE